MDKNKPVRVIVTAKIMAMIVSYGRPTKEEWLLTIPDINWVFIVRWDYVNEHYRAYLLTSENGSDIVLGVSNELYEYIRLWLRNHVSITHLTGIRPIGELERQSRSLEFITPKTIA